VVRRFPPVSGLCSRRFRFREHQYHGGADSNRNALVRRSRWNTHMSDERSDAEQGGVFGNLPGSRPGSRSPRRGSGERKPAPRAAAKPRPRKRAPAASAAEPRRRPAPRPGPDREPEPATARADRESEEAARADSGGIEDLAWAGVAVAAEAATIGVRLASRAIEALRGSSERS
jgi:hypothetical protein